MGMKLDAKDIAIISEVSLLFLSNGWVPGNSSYLLIQCLFFLLSKLLDFLLKGPRLVDFHKGLSKSVFSLFTLLQILHSNQNLLDERIRKIRIFLGAFAHASPMLDLAG
jgi:hypothetical protein